MLHSCEKDFFPNFYYCDSLLFQLSPAQENRGLCELIYVCLLGLIVIGMNMGEYLIYIIMATTLPHLIFNLPIYLLPLNQFPLREQMLA